MSERQIQATILSVGNELTEGVIQNTHLRTLGAELTRLGIVAARGIQIPDQMDLFTGELGRAARESDLVIVTGGLGPTSDDLSREAVAAVAGVPLEFHQPTWEAIQKRFAGRRLSDTNRRQAMIPRGFQVLENANGTAPGFLGEVEKAGGTKGAVVVCLPGPPRELEPMFRGQLVPYLRKRFTLGSPDELWGTSLMVPESELEEALRDARQGDVRWGTRLSDDRITFYLREGTGAEREAMFQRLEERCGPVRIRLGDVFPAGLLFDALLRRQERIALAESCTGGLLGKMLTDLAGSSRVLWGGVIAYSNEAKEKLLGVPRERIERFGAVSPEVARDMAEGALACSAADVGLAVTGIAGPEGGTPEKPVGTVCIAAAHRDGTLLKSRFRFLGDRDMVRRRSAVAAFLLAESVTGRRDWLDRWKDT